MVTVGFLSGAAFLWLSDKLVTRMRRRAENRQGSVGDRLNRIFMLIFSITLHNIPEGLAVGVAFGTLRSGSCTMDGLMGAITIAVGIGLQAILPFALAFAAGAMILVAVHELIPECQHNKQAQPYVATMGIVTGFAVMMLLDVMLG